MALANPPQMTAARNLEASGREVATTRQPGGTELGDQIRAVLLDWGNAECQRRWREMALMFADRAQSIQAIIEPALSEGKDCSLRSLYGLDRSLPGGWSPAGE